MFVQVISVRVDKGKRYAFVKFEDGSVGSVAASPEIKEGMEARLFSRYYVFAGVVRAGVWVARLGS